MFVARKSTLSSAGRSSNGLTITTEFDRRILNCFLKHLDPEKYQTDFVTEGSCNYAFTLVLKMPIRVLMRKTSCKPCVDSDVEFRRGTSGGGNQLRQPLSKKIFGEREFEKYPNVDHVHFYGFYIGNYPGSRKGKNSPACALS